MSYMRSHTLEEHLNAICKYLPNGPLFEAKNIDGSNLRDFLKGCSHIFKDAEDKVLEYVDDVSPLVTQLFIGRWEKAVKIPDDCFSPYEDPLTLSLLSLTYSGGVATAQTNINHGWSSGVKIKIRSADQDFLNGTFIITVTGPDTFTYEIAESGTGTGTGTTITATSSTIFKSNEDRRTQIIAKLSYMSCQETQDFIDLADLFGYTITITPGIDDVSGVTSGLSDTEKRYTIVVNSGLSASNTFPLTFPIYFGNPTADFLRCLLQDSIPSNCQILFNFTG